MREPFAAVYESGNGTKRTSRNVRSAVAIGGKTDMAGAKSTVHSQQTWGMLRIVVLLASSIAD